MFRVHSSDVRPLIKKKNRDFITNPFYRILHFWNFNRVSKKNNPVNSRSAAAAIMFSKTELNQCAFYILCSSIAGISKMRILDFYEIAPRFGRGNFIKIQNPRFC